MGLHTRTNFDVAADDVVMTMHIESESMLQVEREIERQLENGLVLTSPVLTYHDGVTNCVMTLFDCDPDELATSPTELPRCPITDHPIH